MYVNVIASKCVHNHCMLEGQCDMEGSYLNFVTILHIVKSLTLGKFC